MTRKCICVLAVFCAFAWVAIEGRRVFLRPVPAADMHRILRQANREDAIPEGRVISHGIAALNGFALGLKKGILGVALVDGLAQMNLSALSSWNITGLPTLNLTNLWSSSTTTVSKPTVSFNATKEEICFTSRSAASEIVASGEARTPTAVVETGGSPTGSTTPTGTLTSDYGTGNSPTTSDSGAGIRFGSTTASTTQTDGGTVHCIVINKT